MENWLKIHHSWHEIFKSQMDLPYFMDLIQFLNEQKTLSKVVLPPEKYIFNAFNVTSFEKIKVVILGQDPYHGFGQAHGLSFSVPNGVKSPPSLQNIFKELKADLNLTIPNNGNLTNWAKQGVFLLNSFLTVESNLPTSHQNIGWEQFTDYCIATISKEKEHVVFLLWGKFAQEKAKLIDSSKHMVLLAPHPSPFSAHTGFLGCKHFSKTNNYLISKKLEPIDWQIKDEGLFG